MPERTCIVTRSVSDPDALLRFVVGPDGSVVPDLKRQLPGRGCWVGAERRLVDEAVRKKLFRRAFKAEVGIDPGLGQMVDGLLVRAALGALGLARKAGAVALGAAKADAAIRAGNAVCVLHAHEASADGVRKLTQARRAVVFAGGPQTVAYKLFSEAEMGLALGGTNVIHAAVLAADAGRAALRRVVALDRYRGGSLEDRDTVESGEAAPLHKDME